MNKEISLQLQHCLANLPKTSGVYKMLGQHGELLYIGKAKNLKHRVSSYFAKHIDHPKTQALVQRIANIEILLTRSETEALLLEQNLIKAHRPPYNIMLRDDKSYLYIFVSTDQPYPRLASGRGKGKHKIGQFFGPFPSAQYVKETLLTLQKLFYVRQCENSYFQQRKRPCLQYQIKRCSAPCMKFITPEDYAQDVQHSIEFLKGNNKAIQQQFVQKMEAAAEQLNFEQAVFYRDRLALLRDLSVPQAVYKTEGEADIFAIEQHAGVTCIQVMTVRYGQLLGGKAYFPDLWMDQEQHDETLSAASLTEFIIYFYFQVTDDIPKEIILPLPLKQTSSLSQILSQQAGKTVQLKSTVKGTRLEWLHLAKLNAETALQAHLSHHIQLAERFEVLQQWLDRSIERIECFDISHTLGEATTASCVVFDQGGARKRDYRQFNIEGVTAGDDYAAMRQALMKRYKKHPIPDLILIDGGQGQLKVAYQTLQELGRTKAYLIGVSKGEGRKAGRETLHFTDGRKQQLAEDHKALHLIQHIRDEAHRFALRKHRAKRDQRRGKSILELIPQLGEKRRYKLLTHFAGLQGVLDASKEELQQVSGIGEQLADLIYKTLHE